MLSARLGIYRRGLHLSLCQRQCDIFNDNLVRAHVSVSGLTYSSMLAIRQCVAARRVLTKGSGHILSAALTKLASDRTAISPSIFARSIIVNEASRCRSRWSWWSLQ
jgi:hypothetical protein